MIQTCVQTILHPRPTGNGYHAQGE